MDRRGIQESWVPSAGNGVRGDLGQSGVAGRVMDHNRDFRPASLEIQALYEWRVI